MPKEQLNEREFELVNIVGAQLAPSQRDLSRKLNLSLGMTNMLLKRLITKGYIRIQQLNSRKVQYLLTPKGFAEKMRKSVKYTVKTINSISLIKERLKTILKELGDAGQRHFFVVGKSDLAYLIDIVVNEEHIECQVIHCLTYPMETEGGVVLICTEDVFPQEGANSIRLIHELAKDLAV